MASAMKNQPSRSISFLKENTGASLPGGLPARLGVDAYYDFKIDECRELHPESVKIPLSQHIGAPCIPVVVPGQKVSEGELLGQVPEHSLGAPIHAGIDGTISQVTEQFIVIKAGHPSHLQEP